MNTDKLESCACIKDIEARLLEKCKSDDDLGNMRPKGGVIEHIHCRNTSFRMPGFTKVLTIPFVADWKMPTGKFKETCINVEASHCPFCGKEFKP